MNFHDLYSRVFIKEDTTTPEPSNYDVEPLPVPKASNDVEELNKYIFVLNTFLNKLNGIDSRSLQQFVNDVDKPGGVLQGISDTASDITKLAEITASLTQTLHSYVTSANKRRRELALANIPR